MYQCRMNELQGIVRRKYGESPVLLEGIRHCLAGSLTDNELEQRARMVKTTLSFFPQYERHFYLYGCTWDVQSAIDCLYERLREVPRKHYAYYSPKLSRNSSRTSIFQGYGTVGHVDVPISVTYDRSIGGYGKKTIPVIGPVYSESESHSMDIHLGVRLFSSKTSKILLSAFIASGIWYGLSLVGYPPPHRFAIPSQYAEFSKSMAACRMLEDPERGFFLEDHGLGNPPALAPVFDLFGSDAKTVLCAEAAYNQNNP